VSSGVIFV